MTHPAKVWAEAERKRRRKEAEHEWRIFVERVRAALNEINTQETKENPTA